MQTQTYQWLAIGAAILMLGLGCKPPKENPAKADKAESSVANSADKVKPLLVGASVPPLTLRTVDGEQFDLSEAIAAKPTVLVFYRGGWCPFCNAHLVLSSRPSRRSWNRDGRRSPSAPIVRGSSPKRSRSIK